MCIRDSSMAARSAKSTISRDVSVSIRLSQVSNIQLSVSRSIISFDHMFGYNLTTWHSDSRFCVQASFCVWLLPQLLLHSGSFFILLFSFHILDYLANTLVLCFIMIWFSVRLFVTGVRCTYNFARFYWRVCILNMTILSKKKTHNKTEEKSDATHATNHSHGLSLNSIPSHSQVFQTNTILVITLVPL